MRWAAVTVAVVIFPKRLVREIDPASHARFKLVALASEGRHCVLTGTSYAICRRSASAAAFNRDFWAGVHKYAPTLSSLILR